MSTPQETEVEVRLCNLLKHTPNYAIYRLEDKSNCISHVKSFGRLICLRDGDNLVRQSLALFWKSQLPGVDFTNPFIFCVKFLRFDPKFLRSYFGDLNATQWMYEIQTSGFRRFWKASGCKTLRILDVVWNLDAFQTPNFCSKSRHIFENMYLNAPQNLSFSITVDVRNPDIFL